MRRMFRRHIRKTLSQNVPPVLQEANFVFDKGEYGRAGELFERIAQTADARGGARAPMFHLQAGRARVPIGNAIRRQMTEEEIRDALRDRQVAPLLRIAEAQRKSV